MRHCVAAALYPRSSMVCRNMRLDLIGSSPSVLMGLCRSPYLTRRTYMELYGSRQGNRADQENHDKGPISLHATACGDWVGNDHFASPACLPVLQSCLAVWLSSFFLSAPNSFPAADDRHKKEALGFERSKLWRLTRLGRLQERAVLTAGALLAPAPPLLLSALLKTHTHRR